LEHSSEIITKLNGYVKMGTNPNSFKDENESKWLLQYRHINMNDLLGSSSACATILTSMLERVRIQESSSNNNSTATVSFQNRSTNGSYTYMTSQPKGSAQLGVDKIFTAESLKEKNEWVIERLYHVGLPFMSSTDGRRFATQAELTAHLDGLFKKRLLEKSMERNEERGWYPSVIIWSGQQTSGSKEVGDGSGTRDTNTMSLAATGNDDLSITATVTADESRDRCVLCGLNFTMFFDQEEGEWKYKNCHEVEVLNSDAVGETGSDLMLVHVSCLRGLGSPHVLYLDQIVPTAAIGKY
jgi:pre-mRNA cleavage complex 2 protein Pcf11